MAVRGGEHLQFRPDFKERASKFTDIAVIREPRGVYPTEMTRFRGDLTRAGFIPLVIPKSYGKAGNSQEFVKWFPTDNFREVGGKVLVNHREGLDEVISSMKRLVPHHPFYNELDTKTVDIDLAGGSYVYLDSHKLFIYSRDESDRSTKRKIKKALGDDWSILSVPTQRVKLHTDEFYQDLDFLMGLFQGRDGAPHALVAESFQKYVPDGITAHVIPDEEASKGGCNFADLRSGTVIVSQNPSAALTAHMTLVEHAKAHIITAPANFLEDDGGPRCSISSLRIE